MAQQNLSKPAVASEGTIYFTSISVILLMLGLISAVIFHLISANFLIGTSSLAGVSISFIFIQFKKTVDDKS